MDSDPHLHRLLAAADPARLLHGNEYLAWAIRRFPAARWNLARGGLASVPAADVGVPPRLHDPLGWDMLRDKLADHAGCDPDCLVPALGASHALWLAYATALKPGDDVLVEAPAYQPMVRIPASLGAQVRLFWRQPGDGHALVVDDVIAAMTSRTRVVAVSNLHNPTGAWTPPQDIDRLALACARRGATLLVDEVYAGFHAQARATPLRTRMRDNLVLVSSLSKTHGMGLFRIGWLAGAPARMRRAREALLATIGDPYPQMHANLAAHAVDRAVDLAAQAEGALRRKRDIVDDWVRARPALSWTPPAAGPFGWVTARRDCDIAALVERNADREGVLVAPGVFFGCPRSFRLSWSVGEPELRQALAALDRLLEPALGLPAAALQD